jgi:hypothetical protein
MATYNLEEAQQAVAKAPAPNRLVPVPSVGGPPDERRFHPFSIPQRPRFLSITPPVSSISPGSFEVVAATVVETGVAGESVEVSGSAVGSSLAGPLGDLPPS